MSVETIRCPSCQHGLKVGEQLKGKRVRCPKCQNILTVPSAAVPAAAAGWHVARGKEKLGPYSATQMKEMAAAGELDADDKVMRTGNPKWLVAGSVKGLFPTTPTPAAPPEPDEPAPAADDDAEESRPKRKKKDGSKRKKAAAGRKVPLALLLGGGGGLGLLLLAGLAVGGYFIFGGSGAANNTSRPAGPGGGMTNPLAAQVGIVGTWVVSSAILDGKEGQEMVGDRLIFKEDGTCTITSAGSGVEAGTYKHDGAAKPMTLDLKIASDPKTGLFLCEITGDTMRICMGKEITKRPADFTPGAGIGLLTLKRQAPSGPGGSGTPAAKLVATWVATAATVDGKENTRLNGSSFTFKDDGSFAIVMGKDSPITGTYRCDTTAKPMTLDLTYSGQVTPNELYIFDIAGDTLTLCSNIPEPGKKQRPTEIKSGPKLGLFTLKRQP